MKKFSTIEDAVGNRLHQIYDMATSHDWSLVGKSVGFRDPVTGRIEEGGRRVRGGWFNEFPELSDGPTKAAKAIKAGKGLVYRRILGQVTKAALPYVKRERKKKTPSVPSHESLTGKCKLCHVPHSKKQHRFHGSGAFHKTHMWGFKMNRRKKRAVRNPPETPTLIYGKVLQVTAQKTQKHRCDAGCRKVNHRYFHDFKTSPKEWGLPAGVILILPNGQRLKVKERSLLIAKSLSS